MKYILLAAAMLLAALATLQPENNHLPLPHAAGPEPGMESKPKATASSTAPTTAMQSAYQTEEADVYPRLAAFLMYQCAMERLDPDGQWMEGPGLTPDSDGPINPDRFLHQIMLFKSR